MRFSQIKTIVQAHINAGDTRTCFLISGTPGCGKSALGYEIAREGNFDHVADLNFSNLDIPDIAGLALMGDTNSDVLSFKKSPLLAPLQTGRNLIIMDEVADCSQAMQNLQRRLFWNREVNGLQLSPETYFVMMSNRAKDKAGAGRLSGKVKNAVSQLTMETHVDDYIHNYCIPTGMDPVQIQFHRYRPGLIDMYDPDADISPSPRQWAGVSRVPTSLPKELYFADVASKVGEGNAAEYVAFRKIYADLVSPEDVIMHPTTTPIPEDLSAQCAIIGSLSHHTTLGNVDRVFTYVERMSADFAILYWLDTRARLPAVKGTKAFIKWATSNANVLLGDR